MKLRVLLTHRKLLQVEAIILITRPARDCLRNFGLKVGMVGASRSAW